MNGKRVTEGAAEQLLVMRRQGWHMMYLGALIALDINDSDAAKTLSGITSSDEEAITAITRIRHASISERAAAERKQPSGNPLFPAFQYLREERALEAFRKPGAEPVVICALERKEPAAKSFDPPDWFRELARADQNDILERCKLTRAAGGDCADPPGESDLAAAWSVVRRATGRA